MPIKRRQINSNLTKGNNAKIEEKIELFASKAELQQQLTLAKNAKPTIGMTVKLNEYEHKLLKSVAKGKGRSMQKQLKRILIKELEKYSLTSL